ncbi:MAG TPA: glycosyltransferase family 4 protein [Solirubrobacteraceae bacterium]|jgi:glycosyltransferase involved in cell wall biosynthesis
MRVHVVDPSSYTPAYDDALCSALAQAGVEVQLFTSRFQYGPLHGERAYLRNEFFYRRSHSSARSGQRGHTGVAVKLFEHIPDMLRYRAAARSAEIVHFQWLTVQPLDIHLLPSGRPVVLTAHDILPREPRTGQLRAQRRLYERVDAIVVHSFHGQRRLVEELGVDHERVHVIPHGVLRPGAGQPELPLPEGLREVRGQVVLFFGLLRPYKGIELLLDAWSGVDGAELWIVGMPRMDTSALRAKAPANVRFLESFIPNAQIPAFMRRASFVVLPYSEIDQSGVLFTALGYGRPLLLSDVGGFPEVAHTGAARLFNAGDADALRQALLDLLRNEAVLVDMCAKARAAADGCYSWHSLARRHLDLYAQLLD